MKTSKFKIWWNIFKQSEGFLDSFFSIIFGWMPAWNIGGDFYNIHLIYDGHEHDYYNSASGSGELLECKTCGKFK